MRKSDGEIISIEFGGINLPCFSRLASAITEINSCFVEEELRRVLAFAAAPYPTTLRPSATVLSSQIVKSRSILFTFLE